MRTETITRNIYTLDELATGAKQTAREWFLKGAFDYEWWDQIYEDAKTTAALLGINIKNIYFSGFASQGDGACFAGSYSYAKNSVRAIKEYAPKDETLHAIAQGLYELQKPWFYALTARTLPAGPYQNQYNTSIEVDSDIEMTGDARDILEAEQRLTELLQDFMGWIYKQLETEYDYMHTNEYVDEAILSNGYEFYSDGSKV